MGANIDEKTFKAGFDMFGEEQVQMKSDIADLQTSMRIVVDVLLEIRKAFGDERNKLVYARRIKAV